MKYLFLSLLLLSAQPALSTTIAWDGKMLAADTQMSSGGTKTYGTKLFRVGNLVIACAGFLFDRDLFLKWASNPLNPYPKLSEGFMALVIKPNGECWEYYDTPSPAYRVAPVAIGSGMDSALAAMTLGFPATKAVDTASKIDTGTGGEIEYVEIVKKPLDKNYHPFLTH